MQTMLKSFISNQLFPFLLKKRVTLFLNVFFAHFGIQGADKGHFTVHFVFTLLTFLKASS